MLKFKLSIRKEKKSDLSDFDYVMVVGLSISESLICWDFFHTTISRVYRKWSEKEKNIH